MRAALITGLGKSPELAERPDPTGEAVYEISAVSLNPIDVNVGAGRYFAGHPELPYVPGCEGVGRSSDGRRVYLFSDGLGPDGVSARVLDVTRNVVRLQTGYLYHYAFAMLIGVAGLITWFMFGAGGQ